MANRLASLRLHKVTLEVTIAASSLERDIEEAGLLNCRADLDVSGDKHHVRNPESKIAFDRYQLEFCNIERLSDFFQRSSNRMATSRGLAPASRRAIEHVL